MQNTTYLQVVTNSASLAPSARSASITQAVYLLRTIKPSLSAGSYKFYRYVSFSFIFLILLKIMASDILHILSGLNSITQCLFKFFLIWKAVDSYTITLQTDSKQNLPLYAILVPMYLEANKVETIITAIDKLNYPKEKLEVKLVIEEDDISTQKELALYQLPAHFTVIKVPNFGPRTKPKALNYAFQYIKAEYMAIFDAEDRPDPDQLLKALKLFNHLDEKYICLQARLNFYNKDETLFTRMQSIEYSIWFEYLLQGLSNIAHFIPLGGTSCHFKVSILRKIGLWDPFNVTEDLDLGIRIYLMGYKTYILNSLTVEEAVLDIPSWLKQRTRWIKGFMQSYIVFCHNRAQFALPLSKQLSIDLFVFGSIFSFLIPPWALIFDTNNLVDYVLIYAGGLLSLIHIITCSIIVLRKTQNIKLMQAVIAMPFYFVLHTIAAYCAAIELAIAPFRWNKTMHGISKIQ